MDQGPCHHQAVSILVTGISYLASQTTSSFLIKQSGLPLPFPGHMSFTRSLVHSLPSQLTFIYATG